jgi:NAD-dependent deacetylase
MQPSRLIAQAIDFLQDARQVVALTGAGISTPSGIPDFRSPKAGLWEDVDLMEVASIAAFRRHPERFYEWLRPLATTITEAAPNAAHYALAALEHRGPLRGVITQNIDLLHSRAGSRSVLEVHGHMREAVCVTCHFVAEAGPLLQDFMAHGRLPRCPRCHHVMKPNVVLFGELLPWQALKKAQHLSRTSDLMLVVGTSLEVAPAGDLPEMAKHHGARVIIINRAETHMDGMADLVIHGDVAEVLPELAAAFASPQPAIYPETTTSAGLSAVPASAWRPAGNTVSTG